jgi:FAD dependent oxidoreductase
VLASTSASCPTSCSSTASKVPALNVNSTELVTDLAGEATRGGALLQRTGVVDAITPTQTGWEVRSGPDSGADIVTATVVVLALGVGNVSLFPGLQPRLEKRQLFVLDLPVDEDRARMPHVVARVGHGYAYVFVKNLPEGQRVLLGHEDLVPDDDPTGPVDYLAQLLEAGVADAFPFLGAARADRILWGMDWADKFPGSALANSRRCWPSIAGAVFGPALALGARLRRRSSAR